MRGGEREEMREVREKGEGKHKVREKWVENGREELFFHLW